MINKIIKTTSLFLAAVVLAGLCFSTPVKAVTPEEQFLLSQMQAQQNAIIAAETYFKLQEEVAKAEGRKISDIEMVKRQALQGIITGDLRLLDMGNQALSVAYPPGEANIAYMDEAAANGMVSGLKYLEDIKQKTWMQYTWRTH